MNASPTQLSLDRLRRDGYLVDVVERWTPNLSGLAGPGPGRRHDLFEILDLVALRGDETLGVQVTTRGNVSSRVRKIANADATPWLREAGWRLVVHGWDQPDGPRTAYRLREVDVS